MKINPLSKCTPTKQESQQWFKYPSSTLFLSFAIKSVKNAWFIELPSFSLYRIMG